MFESFFPKPKLFLLSLVAWILVVISFYYLFGKSLAGYLGFNLFEDSETVIGLGYFITPEFLFFDIYYVVATLIFYFFWAYHSPHKWQRWSILGSSLLILMAYLTVQVSVVINAWYGPFYNDVQKALNGNAEVTDSDLYGHLAVFCIIVFPYIVFVPLKLFFTSHYVFRWRNAMNDYYLEKWSQVRKVEGASQRIQEDTMRFSGIMQGLGVAMVDSVMTLISFLPVLSALSVHIKEMPLVGTIPYPLVTLAIVWSVFGTFLLIFAGIKLPGLEFKNQRVEAAFRKELVYGEDNSDRAEPVSLVELFNNVRRNYFKIYFHYAYFNLVRYLYLQADNIIVYIFIIPTIVSGRITLGIMNQILRAFGQVASSFQFLVNSWTTIIDLISIYKRLQAFEASISGGQLPKIDRDFIERQGLED
ncbi:MAG: peptide antibiotic transporter SbmA [Paracoccaceae bacterium]|nr:MAG: peptide antibiotic transporter SbmA [Alphaproteobacteria bacterium]